MQHGRILFECNRESVHFVLPPGQKFCPSPGVWDLSVKAARFPRRRAEEFSRPS